MIFKPVFFLGISILCMSATVKPAISLTRPLSVSQMSSIEHAGDSTKKLMVVRWIHISSDVAISEYFEYMDSLVNAYDSLVSYPLTEHLLVRANPWIIDTLANTDYYRMMARDSFVYDQRKLLVLKPLDSLMVPDSLTATHILASFRNTYLDVNIPEFRLRIYQDSVLHFTFPVRVGKNAKKYLAMGDKITDLRTMTGRGEIVRLERNPKFYNPVDQKRFYLTKRDDKKTTLMPQIPWIETEINGIRNGQMIHPTTNPKTLGKASSNGCIGTKESDAWIIYYYAPLGTAITIRYDLEITNVKGDKVKLKDIYSYRY
jgi:L,D-transpeptidase ErfK/SrfK